MAASKKITAVTLSSRCHSIIGDIALTKGKLAMPGDRLKAWARECLALKAAQRSLISHELLAVAARLMREAPEPGKEVIVQLVSLSALIELGPGAPGSAKRPASKGW